MSRHSALEDLRATTLKAVTGTLRKLEYLAGLRNREGTYLHWGLARIHGELAASRALEQEHRLVITKILSTPLQGLVSDAEKSSELAGVAPPVYLQRLLQQEGLLPPEPGGGSERHLSSVLQALWHLTRARPDATHPASLQRRQPGLPLPLPADSEELAPEPATEGGIAE
jgi:hypothetical protein